MLSALALSAIATSASSQVVSTSFQQGANGYTGTFDRRISDRPADETNGIDSASYFLDGFAADGTSPDTQNLIRFANIIGNGAGQVPQGATILDARLTVTTSLVGNAQTAGPFGVAGLNQPFDAATSYFTDFISDLAVSDFGSRGAWWGDINPSTGNPYATRPTGGFGFQVPGQRDSANITSVVQSWSTDPSTNFGLVMQAGLSNAQASAANTTDGWSIRTTGYPFIDSRPRLDITYTTAAVETNVFQNGLNGYAGDTMAVVRSGPNALVEDVAAGEITQDGLSLGDQTFLDGVIFTNTAGDTSSPDDLGLFRFDGMFGAAAGQAPADVPVAKAWLVLTTGDLSTAARSSGEWSAHTVLRDWDTTTLHSAFGSQSGLQVGDGDISPALDTQGGFIQGAEAWFDVTDYVEGVRNGADNFGVAVIADGTGDGWQIHTNGSSNFDARPRLVVLSADLGIVSPGLLGDFNDDGIVDAADYTVWRDNLGTTADLAGNSNGDGIVDAEDYNLWRANFGNTASGGGPFLASGGNGAVPEPSTLMLLAVVAASSLVARRVRK
jgi:hypothetical protein